MILTEETKISEILKEKPEALEAIISLNKHFKKLKNPVLRRVLAPRVNVKQAAEIGNTRVYEFLKKMEEIGFTVLYGELGQESDIPEAETQFPDTYTLDVRPVIEAGADPFKDIMSKLKEMKEREGDPKIKARIRSIQRQMAMGRMMSEVPKSDVVITNPIKIAVAIRYDSKTMYAPKVVAKGYGFIAAKIKEIARRYGVPIVENKWLARMLVRVEVGQYIPSRLYRAVAEVLAYIYQLRGRYYEVA